VTAPRTLPGCCDGTGFRIIEEGDSYVMARNCPVCNPLGGLTVTTTSRSAGTIRFGEADARWRRIAGNRQA